MTTPSARASVRRYLTLLAAHDRPEVWISHWPEPTLMRAARDIDRRVEAGEELPLAGLLFAVKDNIDVAGLPTTAAFPGLNRRPDVSAPCVQLLMDAGALVVGKTNLDQFATGLVGTRSPYGKVRNAIDESLVSGGSSSGSAVAVALGLVDFALGTDTAGSGRVPAGFNHIVGVKPTLGLVSSRGVVPACRSYDTVSVFARDLDLASRVLSVIASPDGLDPRSRPWSGSAPLAAPSDPTVGIPTAENLSCLDKETQHEFTQTRDRLERAGIRTEVVDIAPLLSAARLLYDGALVAERAEAYGDVAKAYPGDLDPVVESIVRRASTVLGSELVADQHSLLAAQLDARALFRRVDALVVPTAPTHPSIAAVEADPVMLNTLLGTFTNFVNVLDLSAVAVPGSADPACTRDGITVIAPAFHDQVALDISARLIGQPTAVIPTNGIDLVVFGAHMRGMALTGELERLGARVVGPVTTASGYRMELVDGPVPRPAVVPDPSVSSAIEGEMWQVPVDRLSTVVTELFRPPLGIGRVRLSDGTTPLACVGFAPEGVDISRFVSWRRWVDAQDLEVA